MCLVSLLYLEQRTLSCTNARTPVYYLPIWFQAVDGISAIDSGIHLLPMLLSVVVASILTGLLVSRIGYYTPFMIFGVCLTAIGAGLLTTLEIGTSAGTWIGFQILYGFGFGSCAQAPNMAAQTVLRREEVAIGASLMFFGMQLFGAVFTSVGQNVLDNQLAKRLAGIPGISPRLIQSTGATELLNLIPTEYHAAALDAYNDSLRVCFQIGLIVACLAILGALSMEWRTVRKNIPHKNPDDERAVEEGKGHGNFSVKEAPKAKAEAEVDAHNSTLITMGKPEEKTEQKIDTEKVGGKGITT
jgi:MFS family permease